MNLLYSLRFGIYLFLLLLPLFHPATVRYLDTAGYWFYLFLIPGEWLAARIGSWKKAVLFGLLLVTFPFLADGFTGLALGQAGIGLAAWVITRLVFRKGVIKLLYPEPFVLLFLVFRILRLSRSSAEISQMSRSFDLVVLCLGMAAFILYTYGIYRVEYGQTASLSHHKALVPVLAVLLLLMMSMTLFPRPFADFVRNLSTENDPFQGQYRRVESQGDSAGSDGRLRENETGQQGAQGEGTEQGESPDLLMAGGDWNSSKNQGGQSDRQFLVMIVRSEEEPVYLADRYLSVMDPVEGLEADPGFPLNALMERQFLESWVNPDFGYGAYRTPVWTDIFSTIPDRVSSYVPTKLEPTVQSRRYEPLVYSYRALSMISRISLGNFRPSLRGMEEEERREQAPYLEVNLESGLRKEYEDHLAGILDAEDRLSEKIDKILLSFSTFQYNIGFTDDVSVRAVSRFLFETRTGDCTEFSHAAAFLGRLAGIPSRVVTGYLVTESLQTNAHKRGLEEIRKVYPPLEDLPREELYMVTTSHRHSWVQYYLPRYGWVDYEATAFAIPPPPQGNPNNYDVVIPEIIPRNNPDPAVPIPWFLILRLAAGSAAAVLLFLYLRRWLRLLRLAVLSRREGEQGLKALYRLLLIRLQARGYAVKSQDSTPREYAALYPELEAFARIYTRSLYSPPEKERRKEDLRNLRKEYKYLIRRRRNPVVFCREIFSLRGGRSL